MIPMCGARVGIPAARRVAAAPLRTDRANPARMYDYYLGGKDHFAIDREAAERALAAAPEIREMARANRAFLRRAVGFAARSGIRQFLDIGAGLPAAGDTYEYARAATRGAPPLRPGRAGAPGRDPRVLYVDNDPMVLAHARAHLARPDGSAAVLAADLRDPAVLLADPDLHETLDLDRPVAVVLTAVLHYLTGDDDPRRVVGTLGTALAPGSLVILTHAADDVNTAASRAAADAYRDAGTRLTPRSHAEVSAMFDGLRLAEPGVVRAPYWRPDRALRGSADRMWIYAGVGCKP